MQTISEAQFRNMAQLIQLGSTPERIAKRTGVAKRTVQEFVDGQTRNPIGMSIFEQTTRPPGITREEHEAWLADNGYRGFAEARQGVARRCASQSETQG